jgi:hypothetical protein
MKVLLTLLFLAGIGYIAGAANQRLSEAISSWKGIDFLLIGLSTFRLGRLVSYDRVMEPLRHHFARTVPDATGAGESVEAVGEGARQAIGQLLSCPICTGTWIAAGLVVGMVWAPDGTRLFLWMTAGIGLAEILNGVEEVLCWTGQLNRALAGQALRNQNGKGDEDGRR